MKRLTRRQCLLGVTALTTLGVAGVIGTGLLTPPKDAAARRIAKILRYLIQGEPIPDDVIGVFATAYADRTSPQVTSLRGLLKNTLMQLPYKAYRALAVARGSAHRQYLETTEAELVTAFLLSTNYYSDEVANGAPVAYVGLYDPYEAACQNPLARFVE